MLSKSTPIEGTVISTDFQTRGRGQRHKYWQSEAGKNLLLSIILYPSNLTAGTQFFLSMMTANAITSCLQTLLPPERLRIKWPNDIYFDDKKLGGILIQNNLKKERIESSIIGIGLNVNQTLFDMNLPNPTSLAIESDNQHNIPDLKSKLFDALNHYYSCLNRKEFDKLKQVYESRLFKKGIVSEVHLNTGTVNGIILGVESDGRLLMNINGKIRKLTH